MSAFNFGAPKGSGTYTDANGVRWSIHASPSEMLRGEWTADTEPSSRYGVTSIWGEARDLKRRIDEYAAGFAVVPPPAAAGDSSWWLLLLVGAVVLMDEDRRR